jgi:hypothetical protein
MNLVIVHGPTCVLIPSRSVTMLLSTVTVPVLAAGDGRALTQGMVYEVQAID